MVTSLLEKAKDMKILKVIGEGTVTSQPDQVILSFNVKSKSMEYSTCINNLNTKTDNLRNNIVSADLSKTDLKTTSFNIDSEFRYNNNDDYIFDGYSASHQLVIKLPMDKELLNQVLHRITEGHSEAEIEMDFTIRDQEAVNRKVLARAVQNARQNAETLATAAGVVLGELQQIDYGGSEVRVRHLRSNILCEQSFSDSLHFVDIETADVKSQDSVTLVYEVLQK